MRTSAPWVELSCFGAVLIAGMLVVMWARQPDASCAMPNDVRRHLVLSRETDREHLATDFDSADRVARRYMLASEDKAQQPIRLARCSRTLAEQIAATHGLSPDQLRVSLTDAQ